MDNPGDSKSMAVFFFEEVEEDLVKVGVSKHRVFYGEEAACSYFTRVVLFEGPVGQENLNALKEQLKQRKTALSNTPTSST